MKDVLLSKEDLRKIHPIFKGRFGNILIKIVMRVSGMNKVNRIYDTSKKYEGVDFCKNLLNDVGVKIIVENKEVLDQFGDQAFITVSNHTYGHIDGIAAIDIVGRIRPDFKMMVNFILGQIDTMAMHFITVNPFQGGKLAQRSSLEGVKQCIAHIRDGHPLGFFPAGAVSKTKLRGLKMEIEDREWQASVIKLIKAANVPVVPMYFSGNNSWFFNFLDLVNWRLRSVRLGHEVHNKKGKTIYVRFGEVIMPDELKKHDDIADLGNFLKSKTYALARKKDSKDFHSGQTIK